MLDFTRRLRPRPRTSSRGIASTVRPTLERLEGRALLAPLAPAGLAATGVSSSAIALTWTAPVGPGVTGYDVFEHVWIKGVHNPRGSGGTPGHYVYNLVAANLHATSDTVGGLLAGSVHDYVVTAVGATGQSPYSTDASAETWIAPSFPNGPTAFLLSSGAVYSSPVAAQAGLTTQLTLLISGNPLTFSVLSGPATASVDPRSGVVTYRPGANEVGTVNITFKASTPIGSVTQTIQFNVAASNPNLVTPTLSLYATSATYDGQYQPASARAVGIGGTSVAGTFAIAYNGGMGGSPLGVGTTQVLVTFTSYDPKYGNATLLTTYAITKATPAFNYLSSPTIAAGEPSTTVSGTVAAGIAAPAGDVVIVTLNGVSQAATVDAYGNFSTNLATGALPVGNYAITYAFAGDANFNAAIKGGGLLQVIPDAPPRVTLNPNDAQSTDGDSVSFTAAASGSPVPSVQWQVSTDGGLTFTDITGNASATTTTLYFTASVSQSGYEYRAVFTSTAGTATTSVATLTVDSNNGDNGN